MATGKFRSYLELSDLSLDILQDGLKLPSIISKTKYQDISEEEKKNVIIIKEAFTFVDPKRKKVGVFTRSDKDHGTKIGHCSTMLCGNFDTRVCKISGDGDIIYNANVRLHDHVKEISGLFSLSRKKTIPAIFFHDMEKDKRYLFLMFELTCDSTLMPLCYHLDDRKGDLFIGMRDINEVKTGSQKYNKTPFEIDNALIGILSSRTKLFSGKFSIADKLLDMKLATFTLVKINLIGM